MSWTILAGDCLDLLGELDAGSIQTCVTSPPYWGLRDYGTDGQLGLEPTPEQYVENLVTVFREVRRVLRDDGTVWLNLGDSYAGSWGAQSRAPKPNVGKESYSIPITAEESDRVLENALRRQRQGLSETQIDAHPKGTHTGSWVKDHASLKPKDLVGIPWRVAFALQADGWWLRSDIIWAKPNPMPESVTDRPTRAHEYIFLLSKSARYFYDADAVRESHARDWNPATNGVVGHNGHLRDVDGGTSLGQSGHSKPEANPAGRNKRSVWTVTTQPYSEAHFATFPPKLIEPCILAGSPPKCCGGCGAPRERHVVQAVEGERHISPKDANPDRNDGPDEPTSRLHSQYFDYRRETLGWRPTCEHDDDSGSATVLDPFAGAGTTGLVATQHGRDFIGIELNPEYAEMARERIRRYEANPAGALEGEPEPIEGQLGFL